MSNDSLLPCPGCAGTCTRVIGGPNTRGGPQFWAGCDVCRWRAWGNTEAEAIATWNTRAAIRALSADRGEAVEKGPWSVIHERGIYERGQWVLQSEDFTHDVRLYINGDFASDAQEQAYAELIAARLNATPPSPAESAERCPHCDDTGDVHRADGEWMGRCDCPDAAPSQMADADARARFEAWARPRWSHYPEAFDIIPGRPEPEYNHDGVQAAWAGWLAAQPQPGRVEGMDHA